MKPRKPAKGLGATRVANRLSTLVADIKSIQRTSAGAEKKDLPNLLQGTSPRKVVSEKMETKTLTVEAAL